MKRQESACIAAFAILLILIASPLAIEINPDSINVINSFYAPLDWWFKQPWVPWIELGAVVLLIGLAIFCIVVNGKEEKNFSK